MITAAALACAQPGVSFVLDSDARYWEVVATGGADTVLEDPYQGHRHHVRYRDGVPVDGDGHVLDEFLGDLPAVVTPTSCSVSRSGTCSQLVEGVCSEAAGPSDVEKVLKMMGCKCSLNFGDLSLPAGMSADEARDRCHITGGVRLGSNHLVTVTGTCPWGEKISL